MLLAYALADRITRLHVVTSVDGSRGRGTSIVAFTLVRVPVQQHGVVTVDAAYAQFVHVTVVVIVFVSARDTIDVLYVDKVVPPIVVERRVAAVAVIFTRPFATFLTPTAATTTIPAITTTFAATTATPKLSIVVVVFGVIIVGVVVFFLNYILCQGSREDGFY